MSNSVEIDASKGVECVENIDMSDSSEVYLGLFWRRATRDMISFQEFKDLAETWLRIIHLERLVEQAYPTPESPEPEEAEEQGLDYKQLYFDLVDSLLTPEEPEEPEEVQIDQHTFVSEKDAQAEIEALKAEAGKGPETPHPPAEPAPSPQGEGGEAPKPGSWAKRELDRKFKQAVVERIREARRMGIGSETIAQNCKGQGVTGDTVRQILQAQAVDVRKYRKIDEALDRLGVPKAQEETDEQKEE